ncbi:hypothetical protein Q5P01_002287 [Channa striata]|uniref:Uncharacterized protein n=1 Tax=Channa striata TaxID=64152 RepID=A0AA88NR36_CHASR|nr:hypothetical protein Q5P01_002287 [Channa striata]
MQAAALSRFRSTPQPRGNRVFAPSSMAVGQLSKRCSSNALTSLLNYAAKKLFPQCPPMKRSVSGAHMLGHFLRVPCNIYNDALV